MPPSPCVCSKGVIGAIALLALEFGQEERTPLRGSDIGVMRAIRCPVISDLSFFYLMCVKVQYIFAKFTDEAPAILSAIRSF